MYVELKCSVSDNENFLEEREGGAFLSTFVNASLPFLFRKLSLYSTRGAKKGNNE